MKNLKRRILDKKRSKLESLNDFIIAISSVYHVFTKCQCLQFANNNYMQSLYGTRVATELKIIRYIP